MANEAKVATAAKEEKNGLSSIFASITIPLCLVVGILIYKFVMGNPANFEGGDPANHPIQEGAGQVLGLVYKGGFIVPILLSLVLMNITFSIERFLTIAKAQGKGRAESFVRKIRTHLDSNNVDAAIKECDVQRGSVANVLRSTLVKYKEMETASNMDLDHKVVSIQKELEESLKL
jgi:biopolymer transport protein ExbB